MTNNANIVNKKISYANNILVTQLIFERFRALNNVALTCISGRGGGGLDRGISDSISQHAVTRGNCTVSSFKELRYVSDKIR